MNTLNNHEISLQTAIDMTKRYRASRPANFPICETFEKEVIQRILDTTDCASFRVYFGMKENQQVSVIMVAADADGNDLLPAASDSVTGTDDPVIIDDGYRCPTICPPGSPINS